MPNQPEIKEMILREAHDSAYSIHPGSTKMYLVIKERFWWYRLKRDVVTHVALCDPKANIRDPPVYSNR